MRNENKYKCSLSWCEEHGECFYKNENVSVPSSKEKVCYHNEWIENLHKEKEIKLQVVKRIEDSDESWNFELQLRENKRKLNEPRCKNPKCKSSADTKLNGVHLCYKCLDLLRENRTNYELGVYFNTQKKILKLFRVIEEISPPKKEMVRCSNIYCGTLDNMTRHHLIPKPFRNRQTVEKIPLCEDCHKRVHQLATNTELAHIYNSKQSILELLSRDVKFRVQRFMNVYENANVMMAVA